MSVWYVYILECSDCTFYTGVTTNVVRRVREHNGEAGPQKGAKYTKARRPVRLVYKETAENRSAAQVREHVLRTMSREEKVRLATSN